MPFSRLSSIRIFAFGFLRQQNGITVEGFWHWRRNRIDFGGAGADSEVVLLL
jgi:hypothetical protein